MFSTVAVQGVADASDATIMLGSGSTSLGHSFLDRPNLSSMLSSCAAIWSPVSSTMVSLARSTLLLEGSVALMLLLDALDCREAKVTLPPPGAGAGSGTLILLLPLEAPLPMLLFDA